MKIFNYNNVSGHILFDVNRLVVLFDTGAPNSIGPELFSFIDKDYSLQNNYMGLTITKLSEYIGTQIDVLMGCDIINEYDVCIDPKQQNLTFGEHLNDEGYNVVLPLKYFMTIPIVEVSIDGQSMAMFFDTGAQLSYIEPDKTNNYKSTGEKEDFYPGIGRFKTKTFDIPTTIGGDEISMKYGILPEMIQMTLMMTDTQGIVGTEIFNYFSCILSYDKKILNLKKWKMKSKVTAKHH